MSHVIRVPRKSIKNSALIRARGTGETLEQMYERAGKPTYLINGGFFSVADGWTLCALKVDGEVVRGKSAVNYGYVLGLNGKEIKFHTIHPEKGETFESIAAGYRHAIELPLMCPTPTNVPGPSSSEPRAAIVQNANEIILAASNGRPDKYTYAAFSQALNSIGADSGFALDGGGSALILHNGRRVNQQPEKRPVANAIALWVDEPAQEPEPPKTTFFDEYRVTSPFGPRVHPIKKVQHFHRGIDLVKAHQAPIYAFVPGEVTHAKEGVTGSGFGNYGIVVAIRDKYGALHCYAHLDSAAVKVGQYVEAGQMIGRQGTTGQSTGSHLHYEVRKKAAPSYGWEASDDCVYEPTEYLINYFAREKPVATGYKDSDVITYGDLKKLGLIK